MWYKFSWIKWDDFQCTLNPVGSHMCNIFTSIFIGDLICALYNQDHNWYRAQCISGFYPANPDTVPNYNNGLPVEVIYIDYGNSEWVPLSRYLFYLLFIYWREKKLKISNFYFDNFFILFANEKDIA